MEVSISVCCEVCGETADVPAEWAAFIDPAHYRCDACQARAEEAPESEQICRICLHEPTDPLRSDPPRIRHKPDFG